MGAGQRIRDNLMEIFEKAGKILAGRTGKQFSCSQALAHIRIRWRAY